MFPNYKRFLFFKVEDGWEDLGPIREKTIVENDKNVIITELCAISRDIIHIGREDGKIFRFCPRCLIIKD